MNLSFNYASINHKITTIDSLFHDSLGENTKPLMVAWQSPADNNYIKNKPKNNKDPKDALLREYQEEIQKLKAC